jgi:hypothetical protein
MASNPAPVTFFGYWSGQLPAVTELHFRSFLRHHPESRYELWLDEDDASAIAAPRLQWITTHPRIAVRSFSLNALIEKHVSEKPVTHYDRHPKLRKAASAVHRKIAPQWARRNAWEHPQFGLTYKHSSRLFGGFTRNKAYRGDLARCLVALEHYPDACLYVDLDVCFTSDLHAQFGDKAWAYRWEELPFANSAILYLPNRSWSAALTRKGNALENFLPWILFADHVCTELGVLVHPARMFDPLWTPGSLLYGDPAKFFAARDNLALDMHALSTERYLAIHWHNNWKTVPARNSIYNGLLKACEGAGP